MPAVEEVQLIEANPEYALVRLPDGREENVSLRHLAPCGDRENSPPTNADHPSQNLEPMDQLQEPLLTELPGSTVEEEAPRRSSRIRSKPSYLRWKTDTALHNVHSNVSMAQSCLKRPIIGVLLSLQNRLAGNPARDAPSRSGQDAASEPQGSRRQLQGEAPLPMALASN
ncbi:hypothetical protein GE061_001948 [Apolygus lucorum]|uniref:Uncharacterized protein n=1 Tax=Apolygus lucorum TaxID=248454 RepID=A0A8S9X6B6_APOLU|nr:hypothetical protein GE061_001948 [Apolygus lucorum]